MDKSSDLPDENPGEVIIPGVREISAMNQLVLFLGLDDENTDIPLTEY